MTQTTTDIAIGRTTVLVAPDGGKYPAGNSLLVSGDAESVLIDPSLALVARRGELTRPDRILHSHCHEDHFAGSHLFPDVAWHYHEADLPAARSLDALMDLYGYRDTIARVWRRRLVEEFHFVPCGDPVPFRDGDIFELGGCEIRVIHLPGHTRGHCVFHILPDDVLFLGAIDLSSFGPYYGDAWSDLEDFERSIAAVRKIEARHYATFHHVGVVDRETFVARLARFAEKIETRERGLLEFLSEPRDMAEIVGHRFVYRPGDETLFLESVEQRSMSLHIERLQRAGRVREVEPGRYLAGQ